ADAAPELRRPVSVIAVTAGIVERLLHLHGATALALVFLLPALESSAFLGFLFPGEIAVILGGVMASQGRFPIAAAAAAAVVGASWGGSGRGGGSWGDGDGPGSRRPPSPSRPGRRTRSGRRAGGTPRTWSGTPFPASADGSAAELRSGIPSDSPSRCRWSR